MNLLQIFLLLLLFFAPSSYASDFPDSDTIDAKAFTDWLTLADLLRSKGIDPVRVNWNPIEMACLQLKTEDDQTAYNRCKFERAYYPVQFSGDNQYCNSQSLSQYPDILAEGLESTAIVQDGQTIFISTMNDIYPLRRKFYISCMHQHNWKNPDNWIDGKFPATPSKH